MDIIKGIEIIDLGLYIKEYKTLVISDVHLGYEESLSQKGVLIPRVQYKDTVERVTKVLKNYDVETVIVTGDLKHEFGVINRSEWKNILDIIDLFLKYAKRLVLIKGNHDVLIPYITKKKGIETYEYYKFGEIIAIHGDEILDNEDFKKSKIILMGHEHPAIGFKEKAKYETYKCFLKGKYENKILIVLPSFNKLTIGTDVLRRELLSPYLQKDLSNFEVFVIEDEKVLNFGKIKYLV